VRRGVSRPSPWWRWLAVGLTLALGRAASAEPCSAPTPACHLENGTELLTSDPRRAAEELLASYQLDERTDTLALYATALALDQRYALALDTWKRVIVFRDGELEAAREAARTSTGRKRAAARVTAARAQKQSEQAAQAIIQLWARVGRVRIRLASGQAVAVTRDGAAVDPAQDVTVNAGGDELVFTHRDGRVERVAVQVAAGAFVKIDAPTGAAAVPPAVARAPQPRERDGAEQPAAPVDPAAKPEPADNAAAAPRPALAAARAASEPRSITLSRVGLGLVAGAVVAGGVAGSFGYLAGRDFDRSRMTGCSADGRCPFGPAADLAQQSNHRARIAQISAVGAAALAATGVTLWWVGRGKSHGTVTDVALHVGPSTSSGGLSTAVSGRF
jgi:hypothetical protein